VAVSGDTAFVGAPLEVRSEPLSRSGMGKVDKRALAVSLDPSGLSAAEIRQMHGLG